MHNAKLGGQRRAPEHKGLGAPVGKEVERAGAGGRQVHHLRFPGAAVADHQHAHHIYMVPTASTRSGRMGFMLAAPLVAPLVAPLAAT